MSTDAKPRVGDIGTLIRINMGEDVSGANALKIFVRKPDKVTYVTWVGVAATNYITFTTPDADELDKEGDWILVPWAENLDGWTGYGDPVVMHVYGIYEVVTG